MDRLLADGYPNSLGRCETVTRVAGLTLPRPLSTARIIYTVAGWRPLSAQRPTHPEILISQGTIAKPPPQPLEGVRSPEAVACPLDAKGCQGRDGKVYGCLPGHF